MKPIRSLIRDDSGVALVLVLFVMVLLAAIAITLPALTLSDQTRSNTAVQTNGALQAAEAGLNVYIADLTEDSGFFLDYIAAGEARRTYNGVQYPTTAGSNANANIGLNPSWSRTATWTYPSNITTDPAWRTVGNSSYQYLIEVFPDSTHLNEVRIISIGRPTPSAATPASDTTLYRAEEAYLSSLSISDFQMLSAASIGYGSGAVTTGWVYATENNSGTPASLTYDKGSTADANVFTENTSSSCSGCSSALVSPARLYSSNSSPSIRTVINEPITFSALQESPQIAPPGGGEGALELDAASSGITLPESTYTGAIPNAWWLKFHTPHEVDIYACWKYSTSSKSGTTYYPVSLDKPTTCTEVDANHPLNTTGGTEIYTTEDLIVSGTVDGQVTAYTAGGGQATSGDDSYATGNVVIADNINYATPGSDVLGLVADQNVIIACWEPENNLNWTAATISLNGIWASDPGVDGSCSMNKSSMTFTGSTATYGGGSMGGFSSRTYNYDPTLRYLPPPDYPQIPSSFKILYERQISVP